jgi:hypothetical protein
MSSAFARRLRLVLWVVAGLIAAGLFSYIAYAETRPTSTDRANAYIEQVNELQDELSVEISRVNQAYREFARSEPADELVPKLRRAEETIGILRARIAALEPPSQAHELHEALLALLADQRKLADEVAGTVAYLVALSELGPPLDRAAATLTRQLRAAETAGRQAEIFTAYARQVQGFRARAVAVDPPPAFEPTHEAFVRRLGQTSALTRRLARAAREADAEAAATAADRLRALSDPQPAVRRAEQAAIRAYNRRVRQTNGLRRAVDRELAELARDLA